MRKRKQEKTERKKTETVQKASERIKQQALKKANEEIERKGGFLEWVFDTAVHPLPDMLSFPTLRRVYRKSSTVRLAIDSIARLISSIEWKIAGANSEAAYELLKRPNANPGGYQSFVSLLVRDLLTFDVAVIQKVYSKTGKLIEIWPRNPEQFQPKVDEFGLIIGYQQTYRGKLEEFSTDEIIWAVLHPRSDSVYGSPIIEGLTNEIASLLLSQAQIGKAFAGEELPPGLLHLGTIGEEAYERMMSSFRAPIGPLKLRAVDGVDKVNWVPFTRPFREMQMQELIQEIEKRILRGFGLAPAAFGFDARQVAIQQIAAQSFLIQPILNLIQELFNIHIIPELAPGGVFMFVKSIEQDLTDKASKLADLVRTGVVSRNEARHELGLAIKTGADELTVTLGNEVIPVRSLAKVNGKKTHPLLSESIGEIAKPSKFASENFIEIIEDESAAAEG